MNKIIFNGFLVIWIILSVGCDINLTSQNPNNKISAELDQEAAKEAYHAYIKNNNIPKLYDEILAEIALEVPGYGGHFIDEEGVFNVYLLDSQESEAVEAVFRQHRKAGVLTINDDLLANLRSRQGRYNFLQLYNWKADLRSSSILGTKGLVSLDINESQNNITLGIEDLTYKEEILEKVHQIGLPKSAINIVKRPPMEYHIRNKRKTLAGGLQIQYIAGSSTNTCTLGPVAQRNGVKGFIVNSHCTETRFSVDNEKFYQAKPSDRHIATETVDPPHFSYTGGCPAGRVCGYADAAFAKWENRGTWSHGRIYKTQYSDPSTGSTNRVGADFTITGTNGGIGVGFTVQKVGITTGWTYGSITETCVDLNVDRSNVTMLCQSTADYGSTRGDSGAPVFNLTLHPSNVDLVGIHWGGSGSVAAFSTVGSIMSHLGGVFDWY